MIQRLTRFVDVKFFVGVQCRSCVESGRGWNWPVVIAFFFFFSRRCNPCGVWPDQLTLSILNRKDFYRVPLPAARQTPNLEDQWFRTFQLPPPGVPSVWNDASEPLQGKVELWARLPRHFWVLLHAVNYDMGLTALLPLRRKARWGFFRRELGYQRPARLPLDQRFSNFFQVGATFISQNVLRTTLLLGLSNSLGLP